MSTPLQVKYFQTLQKRAEANKANLNREQTLAEEVWLYFKKDIAFPRIMKAIKQYGYQWVYECYNEVKKSKVKEPIGLFLWKIKQANITWQ